MAVRARVGRVVASASISGIQTLHQSGPIWDFAVRMAPQLKAAGMAEAPMRSGEIMRNHRTKPFVSYQHTYLSLSNDAKHAMWVHSGTLHLGRIFAKGGALVLPAGNGHRRIVVPNAPLGGRPGGVAGQKPNPWLERAMTKTLRANGL